MTRMSGEFKLVLVLAVLLTAGYLFWPPDDVAVRAANDRGGATDFVVTARSRKATVSAAQRAQRIWRDSLGIPENRL